MPINNFQSHWKNDFPWVREGKLKFTAQCIWCNSTFSFETMGRAALTSHSKGKKHQTVARNQEKNLPINNFLQKETTNEQPRPSSSQPQVPIVVTLQKPTSQQIPTVMNSTLERYKLKDNVTETEITWCLHTVMNHFSLRNSESTVLLLSSIFKDSAVAKEMKLHKDKISYSIVYGIAPYFKDLLKLSLMKDTYYVVGFDESFNEVAQRTQMDLSVRFWDSGCNEVKSRYLNSVFLNEGKALDLMGAFKSGIEGLDHSKILQISMDGPNVNWAFLKLIKPELNANLGPDAPQLLELGSCGLHVVHGAFKRGIMKTEWNIIQFLRALYNLFKMVPARRGTYKEVTGSALFPLQFCNIRWVENSKVARRAIEILPHLKKYVDTVKNTNNEPTSNCFKTVELALNDKLLLAKLGFFQSLAEELEPFLTEFQSDEPLVPFLYDSLIKLIKGVMNRFVKREKMARDDFYKVDLFEKEDGLFKSLLKLKEIELGYGTKSALKKCKDLKDKDILDFRKGIRTCLQHLISKIQEKSPLKYPLTKALRFLNPSLAIEDENLVFIEIAVALEIMIEKNIISASTAEKADREFKEIVCQPHFKLKAERYRRNEERIDRFWMSEVDEAKSSLKGVIMKCLVLSHGNATIERGFSVNKELLVENLREDSLIAQRVVYDAISCAGGLQKWLENPMEKKLLHSMRNAYAKFKEAEEYRKKTMTEKDRRAAEKRKLTFQLKMLEEKKQKTLEKLKEELSSIDEEIKKIKT